MPSRVGIPIAAVKFPSEPPPTATPCRFFIPRSLATTSATPNNVRPADSCIGGRLILPVTFIDAPATVVDNSDISRSMRTFSSGKTTRTSTLIIAASGTTFSALPAVATVGVTVVPSSGRAIATIRRTCSESSISALIPFSGSRPACEARPAICTVKVPTPLRAIFNAPPSALGSSTSTAPVARARASISSREVSEPTSSSAVIKTSTRDES